MTVSEFIKKFSINIGILIFVIVAEIVLLEIFFLYIYKVDDKYFSQSWAKNLSAEHPDLDEEEYYIDKDNALVYRTSDQSIYEERYTRLFRPAVVNKEKPENVYRITIIGDSHACAAGLDSWDGVFSWDLYRMLNKEEMYSEYAYDEFQVLVFCDGGLNTYQEKVLLNELVMKYEPDHLILQYCDNDIAGLRTPFGFNVNGKYISSKTDYIDIEGSVVPQFPHLGQGANLFLLKNSALARFLSFKINLVYHNLENSEEKSLEALADISNTAKINDIKFSVIDFVPAIVDMDLCKNTYEGQGAKLHNKLRSLSNELQFDFYNMCDYVEDLASIRSDKSEVDDHYDIEGNSIAAEVLFNDVNSKLAGEEVVVAGECLNCD